MNRSGPLRRSPMKPRTAPLARSALVRKAVSITRSSEKPAPKPRTPLKPVSNKRAKENRERRSMIARLFPERPKCAVPWCNRGADDVHEPLTRARGGSITDEDNAVPLCRPHHDWLTFAPESELDWAYELGLLVHSWDGGTS